MRILHFSDPHVTIPLCHVPFGKWLGKRAIGGVNLLRGRYRLFAEAEEKIGALVSFQREQQVDLVLCSGDYTALGLRGEYERALHCVRPLMNAPKGYINVPGNHDLYAGDTLQEDRFFTYFGDTLQSDLPEYQVDGPWPLVRLIDDTLAVVVVNSARPNPFPWRSSGRIPQRQLLALQKIAGDARMNQRLVCIMTHYTALLEDGTPDSRLHGLSNYHKFLVACAAFRVGIILSGHIHRCYTVKVEASGQQIFCAGSLTVTGKEGFWLFDVRGNYLQATPGTWNGERYELDTTAAVILNIPMKK